jgi:hypothetical protein
MTSRPSSYRAQLTAAGTAKPQAGRSTRGSSRIEA